MCKPTALLACLAALVALVALTGCNTVAGVGKDMQQAGDAIERAAN